MPSRYQTAAQRGYGYNHQVKRKVALRQLEPGEPCPFCNGPMYREQALDYDHEIPIAIGGDPHGPKRLAHASCNRRAGAQLRSRKANKPTFPPLKTSQEW